VTVTVVAPSALACRRAFNVSAVSPLWVTAITSVSSSIGGAETLYSFASSAVA
jgi:hypothetical protein